MPSVRTFFRRHIIWVGLVAVIVPLLSILALQYSSLRKLEQTSTAAEKMWMKNYLGDVSKDVKYFYYNTAEKVLNVPAYSLAGDNLQRARYPFCKCEVEGTKRLFIVAFGGAEGGAPQTVFFDPQDPERSAQATPAEQTAASIVAAPFRVLHKEGAPLSAVKIGDDQRDPENRIIFKPITDQGSRVVGVAGMVLDTRYFRETLLPRVIDQTLPTYFSEDARENVIVTVHDAQKSLVYATHPVGGQNDETVAGLPFFHDYRIGIRSRHMTPEEWARWNFNFNLTLSLLMTAVLVGGIYLALRTASREMRLSQMKADFVSNVSHELRTPLSSIRVFGEFMKLGRVRDGEKMREYGDHIETESRRLTQLINNILDFSTIESGRKTYKVERVCVEEIIAEVLKTSEVRLRQSDFSIRYVEPAAPLPAADVDRDAIAQALLNLLDNAVKYSEAAEVREVKVRAEHRDGLIHISVADHGVGIPASEQQKIFEKFYRVSTGLVHDVKGSGLGLSLVKHIVEAHRGRVRVESEPGRGSTFTITLPAAGPRGQSAAEGPQAGGVLGPDAPLDFGYKH